MLVLSRKPGERIVVPDCHLSVTIVAIEGGRVRLGITAPRQVDVYRDEVWRAKCQPEEPGERSVDCRNHAEPQEQA